MYRKSLCIFVP